MHRFSALHRRLRRTAPGSLAHCTGRSRAPQRINPRTARILRSVLSLQYSIAKVATFLYKALPL